MSDETNSDSLKVTLDIRVPLSVTFVQVGSRINFVLEEVDPTISTDQSLGPGASKYELHKID